MKAAYIFATCILISATSCSHSQTSDKLTRSPYQYRNSAINKWSKNYPRNNDKTIKIEKELKIDDLDFTEKAIFVRATKRILEDKNKDGVLEDLKQIIRNKDNTQDRNQVDQNIKMTLDKLNQQDLDSIAATDLFNIIMAKQRLVRSVKLKENNNHINAFNKDMYSEFKTVRPDIINSKLNTTPTQNLTQITIKALLDRFTQSNADKITNIKKKMNKTTTKSETLNITNLNKRTNQNLTQISRSIRSTKLKESIINKRIDENNKNRDLVFEVVSKLIENEKSRKQYDLVNPPNSKFSKRQQLLWDRLRIKAAEDLLIHPKTFPQRATERIFESFKMDEELATPVPTDNTRLFDEFKNNVEKQYYLDLLERGRGRVYISTLKPYNYY